MLRHRRVFFGQAWPDDRLATFQQRLKFIALGQARRFNITDALVFQLELGQIKFAASGIDSERDLTAITRNLSAKGQRLQTVRCLHLDAGG